MAERRIDAEDTNAETLVIRPFDTDASEEDDETRALARPWPSGAAILPQRAQASAASSSAPTVPAEPPAPAKARWGLPAKTQQMPPGVGLGGMPTPPPPSAIKHVSAKPEPLQYGGFAERYEMRAVLGIGGMGEVQLCKDKLVGRDVALKVMHDGPDATIDARERFLREARIQGQLEHPAIVPVYDLGVDPKGGVFFTMKRIRGMTLQSVLDGLAEGDAQVRSKFTRRRLLTAFRSVCLAMDFAHVRGVIHRDLKPANIILGDFGEVYVLDWGLAKIMDASGAGEIDITQDPMNQTAHGSMLGTPGYMSPEQACGELERVDGRTDIYSLGALLFEILAGEPLHAQTSLDALIGSTLRGADARPSVRAKQPEIPPELDEVCVRATAIDPEKRTPRARSIAEAIESYLDGDRNVQLRRDLSKDHVKAAHEALTRASEGGEPIQAARSLALREIGSALALDPTNTEALRTMARLVMDVPDTVPPEAEAELKAAAKTARRDAARVGTKRFLLWNAFIPLALWMGVRHLPFAIAAIFAVLLCGGTSWWMSRRSSVGLRQGFALLTLSSIAIALMSMLFGPFILVPGQAATNTMFFAMNADGKARRVVIAMGVLAIAVPFFLDVTGVLPAAYNLTGGQFFVLPRATEFPPLQTMLCLLLTSVAMVIIPGLMMGRMRDALSAAERRLFLQAWHLRQMVPTEAQEALATKGP